MNYLAERAVLEHLVLIVCALRRIYFFPAFREGSVLFPNSSILFPEDDFELRIRRVSVTKLKKEKRFELPQEKMKKRSTTRVKLFFQIRVANRFSPRRIDNERKQSLDDLSLEEKYGASEA